MRKFFVFYLNFFLLLFIPYQIESSQLDFVIQPEIKNDVFYHTIKTIVANPKIKTVLEIGSSSGEGSTEAFVIGLKNNPSKTKLFCLEVSKPRFQVLKKHYENLDFVNCYNLSSISLDEFPKWETVELFMDQVETPLSLVGKKEVLRWHKQDIDYMNSHGAVKNGILKIKEENNIDTFDLVLIDGSEFTGVIELPYVYGAGYILLDDINTYKNYQNFGILKNDPQYELIISDSTVRNGFAIFKRKDF